MAQCLRAISAVGSAWRLAAVVGGVAEGAVCGGARAVHRFNHGARASACGGGTQKNGLDQDLGRSRERLTTKLHAATPDENCSVALHLTPGQAHDGRQFENPYESVPADNVLEF